MGKENRNCINCGAPIDANINKCPYCGTSYFDICGLSMDSETPKPIVLKFKIGNSILTSKVICNSCNITTSFDESTQIDIEFQTISSPRFEKEKVKEWLENDKQM